MIKMNQLEATEPYPSYVGTMEGCLLSPNLFNIFIDDLIEYLNETTNADAPELGGRRVTGLLFADDLITASQTVKGLQNQMNRVAEFADYWRMEININKTECVVFRRGGRLSSKEKWKYKGLPVTVSNRFKYLGIWFSCCHTFNPHVEKVMGRAVQALGAMGRLIHGVGGLPIKLLNHIYEMTVTPILLYGSEIFGLTANVDKLDKVEYKYLRRVLGLANGAPGSALLLETGKTLSASWKSRLRTIKYWEKILMTPEDHLLKLAYRRQRELIGEGVECWATRVRNFLYAYGFDRVWENENPSKHFYTNLKNEIEAQAKAEAIQEAHTKTSLAIYVQKSDWRESSRKILNMEKQERRLLLSARMNLPTYVTFVNSQGKRYKQCKFCRERIEYVWDHLLGVCKDKEVGSARRDSGIDRAIETIIRRDQRKDEIFFESEQSESALQFLTRLDSYKVRKEEK